MAGLRRASEVLCGGRSGHMLSRKSCLLFSGRLALRKPTTSMALDSLAQVLVRRKVCSL